MRVTFVDNLLVTHAGDEAHYDLQPHLGLLSLIAAAQHADHACRLVDPKLELHAGRLSLEAGLYQRLATAILDTAPDVVGLTSLGCNFACTVQVARCLKHERPDLPVLLGGPHASILDRAILSRFPEFDAIVRHEGELVLPLLLRALPERAFETVPSLSWRRGTEVRVNASGPIIELLDDLPPADYSHHPIAELGLRSLRLEAGRGCPFECTFCSTATFFGRRYRLKSPQRLIGEMRALKDDYGVADFSLTHDLFTVNKAKVRAFCDAVAGQGFTWSCSARPDCVDPDLLGQMAEAGCREIYYGIETGSVALQQRTRKKLHLAGVEPILAATRVVGMGMSVSYITGFPDETDDDQDDTLDAIGRTYAFGPQGLNVQLHLLTPEPGTRLVADLSDGLLYDGHVTDFNFPPLEPDDDALLHSDPEIFVNHHYFPTRTIRARNIWLTEFLPCLHALGLPLAGEIVARHDGRLSLFLKALHLWWAAHSHPAPYDLLPAYFAEVFGLDDPLTQVMRYAAAGAQLLEVSSASSDVAGLDPAGGRFKLSSRAVLLDALPDAPSLIAGLTAGLSLDRAALEPMLARRGPWLICVASKGERMLRNYRIDRETAAVAAFLRTPRSVADCHQVFADTVPPARIDLLLGQLTALGLLSPVGREPA